MKYLSVFTLGLLLVSCAQPIEKSDATLMRIKGQGKIEIEADEASITVYLTCTEPTVERSKACLLKQSEEFNKLLTEYGIEKNDLATTSINMYKDYTWTSNGRKFVGYKASIDTKVKFKNIRTLELVYPKLLSEEKWSLSALSYSHSKKDSLSRAVYNLALDDANALADQLLIKLDKKKKRITQIANLPLATSGVSIDQRDKVDDEYNVRKNYEVKEKSVEIHANKLVFTQTLNLEYLLH